MRPIEKWGVFYQAFDDSVLILKHIIDGQCNVSSESIAKFTREEYSLQGCE